MKDNKWARLLGYVTELVNQEMLLQNQYLIAENRILRSQLPKRFCCKGCVASRWRSDMSQRGGGWELLYAEKGTEDPSLSAPVVLRNPEDLAFSDHVGCFDAINHVAGCCD